MDRTADSFSDRVSTWSHLADLVDHFSYFNGHDWLFRGVTDSSHGLLPKVGRTQTRKLKVDPRTNERAHVPYRLTDERAIFTMFKQQARAYLPSAPESPLEWLAIAQHFGLPTRLLDWTDSLLAAAWFAVEKGGGDKNPSAIWVTRGVSSIELDYPGDPLLLDEPRVYRPPHISPRIVAQGSVLMICPKPTEEVALPVARRIVVDSSVEFTIKKRLNACGVNRRHLFPDLAGLTDHLRWIYENDWLAGYREVVTADFRPTSDDDSHGEVVK